MKLELLDTSAVVVADTHNPTILHPSFLTSQGIVPEDWELVAPPLSTLPLSIVKYKNGVEFRVDADKLRVTQSPPPSPFTEAEAASLALKYVRILKHVSYTAIGINFRAILHHKTPEEHLIERFLVKGVWNQDERTLSALGLTFVYPISNGKLNLIVNPGGATHGFTGKHAPGIVIEANYHTDLVPGEPLQLAQEFLSAEKFRERCDTFQRLVATVFGPDVEVSL